MAVEQKTKITEKSLFVFKEEEDEKSSRSAFFRFLFFLMFNIYQVMIIFMSFHLKLCIATYFVLKLVFILSTVSLLVPWYIHPDI